MVHGAAHSSRITGSMTWLESSCFELSIDVGVGGSPRGTEIFGGPRRDFGAQMHEALASTNFFSISILKNIVPCSFFARISNPVLDSKSDLDSKSYDIGPNF